MNEQLFDKFKSVWTAVSESLTKEDFNKAFEAILKVVLRVENDLIDRIDRKLASIHQPKDGKDGKDGNNGKDGKSVVGPPGPPGPPGVGEMGPQGLPGKDGSPDTPQQVRDKLEVLNGNERLSIAAINNLREELDDLKKRLGRAGGTVFVGGSTRGAVKLYDISSQLNGILKTFPLPTFWRVSDVSSSSFPHAFRPTVDYTTDASAMTITFTSQIDAATTLATGQTVLIEYAEA